MKEIGIKIRAERKKNKLTLNQLAKKAGISPVTLQRIETGKSSPSVFLLSEIAHLLQEPVYSFFSEIDQPVTLLKNRNQRFMSEGALKVGVVGPRKMIDDNIVVTYGELNKGGKIGPHTNPGSEWAYNIQGKCRLEIGSRSYILGTRDSVCYNARLEHTVTALEELRFLSIYLEDKGFSGRR
jgi:transcriptional regulator with XRE-family HTH domain